MRGRADLYEIEEAGELKMQTNHLGIKPQVLAFALHGKNHEKLFVDGDDYMQMLDKKE